MSAENSGGLVELGHWLKIIFSGEDLEKAVSKIRVRFNWHFRGEIIS